MSTSAAPAQATPAHGLSIVEGQPELDSRSLRSALAEAPHIVEALAPAPAPAARAEETYDNVPSFAAEGPAPRF